MTYPAEQHILARPGWFLGEPPHTPIPGAKGIRLYVGSSVQRTIAFIGVPHIGAAGGIHCTGTAFLLHYKGCGYLVTARHCVEEYEDKDFLIRVNKGELGANMLIAEKGTRWHYHTDSTVDAAAIPLNLTPQQGFECQYLHESLLLTNEKMAAESIDVGQICYTVGLFRPISGVDRNLPLVYTGNIALFSETYIPVWHRARSQTIKLWGSLIQTPGIHGSSGSPVFVRPAGIIENSQIMAVSKQIYLFGLLVTAWFLPPDEAARSEFGATANDTVPVGLGVVVQSTRIIELLEQEELVEHRRATQPKQLIDGLEAV